MLLVIGCASVVQPAYSQYVFDANDFAVEVISSSQLDGSGLYNDPLAVLGRPTLRFNNSFNPNVADFRRTKLIEAAFNRGLSGEKVITTFNTGQSVVVRMGRPVRDDPDNPFGIDLIVFGNAFFTGSGGAVSDSTALGNFTLAGIFAENVRVSVSPDLVQWFTFTGSTGDGLFPTNAYIWDAMTDTWTDQESDPTLPVNPMLTLADITGQSAEAALELYAGSAGGAGLDLAEVGVAEILYVRFDGIQGFAGGEIDAVADVRATPGDRQPPLLLSCVSRKMHSSD